MVHHCVAAYQETASARAPFAVEHYVECLALGCGLQLAPVEIKVDEGITGVVLHQETAYVALEICE